MENLQEIGSELKAFTDKAHSTLEVQNSRLLAIEQAITARGDGSFGEHGDGDVGQKVISSPEFKAFHASNVRSSGQINVGSFHKSNLINAAGLNQPLVPP